jgi:Domain of unknown function (DUF4331)
MITTGLARNAAAAGLALALAVGGASIAVVQAADHMEAPGTQADKAADLADVYAWHDAGKLVVAMTFAGLTDPPDVAPTYDANVLYTFHLDRNADYIPDVNIECRFGQNRAGAWGIQAMNIPGRTDPLSGAVDTNIDGGDGIMLFAGFRDDPFFFDFDGFVQTRDTGTLSFDNTRDTFEGRNVTAIVIEMDAEDATGTGESDVNVWATTARKP